MTLTRSRRGRWYVVLATLLALTGCAAPGETPAATGAPDSGALPAAEGTTQYPLTLTTWAGESVLQQRPERIAVIGFSPNLDALEVLDVTPVYTQAEESEWPWRDQQWLAGVEFPDTATRRDPINFEGIAAANPDLIIAVNFVQEVADFDKLAAIAPVLENSEKIVGDQIEWQDTQRLVGRALDLAAASDRVVAEAEQTIDDTAATNPQFAGRTITVATEYSGSGIEYYTVAGGTAEGVVRRMGFAPNPLAANFVTDPVVSEENLALLDADVLIIAFVDAAARDARAALPLFQALPPVADGRYVTIVTDEPGSEIIWVLRRGASATSLPWAVEVIADRANQAGLT